MVANIGSSKSEGTPRNNAEKNSNNDLIYTGDHESEFHAVDKVGKVDNTQVNEGSDIDQLRNSLNNLTIHPNSNVFVQVKQLTVTTSVIQLHSIISYQKSKVRFCIINQVIIFGIKHTN